MTRVVDCSQYLRNLTIERKILSGNYDVMKLRKMKLDRLEKVLSNMIKLSAELRAKNAKRPEWWPDDVIFLSTIDSMRKEAEGASMKRSWRTIVRDTLASCNEFYRKAPLNLMKDSKDRRKGEGVVMRKRRSSTPVHEEKRRRIERSPLKLLTNNTTPKLAITPTKLALTPTKLLFTPQKLEQTPTIVRKLEGPTQLELSAVTTPQLPTTQVDLSSVTNPPLPIQLNLTPVLPTHKSLNLVVKLTDVLKPKPVAKNDFMNFLNLNPKGSICKRSQSEDIDTRKYSNNIPFSSDIGRILMRRERYTLSKELYSRKAEKLEYYLKEQPVITKDKEYEISYNRKHSCDHIYNFPKRQLTQGDRYIQNLTDSLCKPVSVSLERIDVDKCLCELKGCRDVRVVLERLNVD